MNMDLEVGISRRRGNRYDKDGESTVPVRISCTGFGSRYLYRLETALPAGFSFMASVGTVRVQTTSFLGVCTPELPGGMRPLAGWAFRNGMRAANEGNYRTGRLLRYRA